MSERPRSKGKLCQECDFFHVDLNLVTWCRREPPKGFRTLKKDGTVMMQSSYTPIDPDCIACGEFEPQMVIQLPGHNN